MSRKQRPNRALEGGRAVLGRAVLGVHTEQCCNIPSHPSLTRTEGTVHPLGRMECANCSRWMDPGQLPVTTGGGWGWCVGSRWVP